MRLTIQTQLKENLIYLIYLGDHNRRINEGSEQTIQVSQIIVHEKYGSLNNDIALLKLSRPVMFNDKIQPICLPRQGEAPAVGSKCYITGNNLKSLLMTRSYYKGKLGLQGRVHNLEVNLGSFSGGPTIVGTADLENYAFLTGFSM